MFLTFYNPSSSLPATSVTLPLPASAGRFAPFHFFMVVFLSVINTEEEFQTPVSFPHFSSSVNTQTHQKSGALIQIIFGSLMVREKTEPEQLQDESQT